MTILGLGLDESDPLYGCQEAATFITGTDSPQQLAEQDPNYHKEYHAVQAFRIPDTPGFRAEYAGRILLEDISGHIGDLVQREGPIKSAGDKVSCVFKSGNKFPLKSICSVMSDLYNAQEIEIP